jgi:hypothetical protein
MGNYTRREILQMLSILFPVSLVCSQDEKSDNFERERVCAHVFQPGFNIPDPLLAEHVNVPSRDEVRNLFKIYIPELLICTTSTMFLDIFQYFWPITRDEFNRLQGSIRVLFKKIEIFHKKDVDELAAFVQTNNDSIRSAGTTLVVVFTLNDYTKYWSAELVKSWQKSNIEEFVVFKGPTKSPYLCDYPSLQKGFKKQPQ